jgi:hypothetical protein
MHIRISGPGAHCANGLQELVGGDALTGWPNNVASIYGSCDRCRAIWASWFIAPTAEEENARDAKAQSLDQFCDRRAPRRGAKSCANWSVVVLLSAGSRVIRRLSWPVPPL